MANIAGVAYAIEGPKEALESIKDAIEVAIKSNSNQYEEALVCDYLGILYSKGETRLRGSIIDEPYYDDNGTLRFCAEEAWSLQDFEKLLKRQFSDIKVYFMVEEPGLEVYWTNDKEGKYFIERYYADVCIDGMYNSEYFRTENEVYNWLEKLTDGTVKSKEDVGKFNRTHEDSGTDDENFILIHEFEVGD